MCRAMIQLGQYNRMDSRRMSNLVRVYESTMSVDLIITVRFVAQIKSIDMGVSVREQEKDDSTKKILTYNSKYSFLPLT